MEWLKLIGRVVINSYLLYLPNFPENVFCIFAKKVEVEVGWVGRFCKSRGLVEVVVR